jgi:hypothetical protein
MDTLLREPGEIITADAPDISILEPREAELGVDHAWLVPDVEAAEPEDAAPTRLQPPTYLHPVVVVAAVGGYAWFLLAFWVAFLGYGYMTLTMDLATLISGTIIGLMVGGVVAGRNMTPWQRPWHSFREFLDGEVEVWGARVSGRDAFFQLAGMSWLLAALATTFAVIVAVVRTT